MIRPLAAGASGASGSARALFVLALLSCQRQTIELGRPDATVDARPPDAQNACRCRVVPCRLPSDCALTAGTCGADFYCSGDFGACTTDATCHAVAMMSACTKTAVSTDPCGM
jgi:hypothetical protein